VKRVLTTAMTGATFAVINASENGWTCAATAVGGVVAVASVCLFIPAQRRAAHPVLPASLFATRGSRSAARAVAVAAIFDSDMRIWLQRHSLGLPTPKCGRAK
jgi:anti-sigma-K factor RskA